MWCSVLQMFQTDANIKKILFVFVVAVLNGNRFLIPKTSVHNFSWKTNGRWTISLLRFWCKVKLISLSFLAVSCGSPVAPVNGGMLAADYSAGTRATYFCNDGFRLSSKEVTSTVCQADGTWSNHNKIPRCTGENRHPSFQSSKTFHGLNGYIHSDRRWKMAVWR